MQSSITPDLIHHMGKCQNTQKNVKNNRAKRLALSQQLITRLQVCRTKTYMKHKYEKMIHKSSTALTWDNTNYLRVSTCLTIPTLLSVLVWIKTLIVKVTKYGRGKRSGIDTIKYHIWPGIPEGKVTKIHENITNKRVKRSALSKQVTTK